jgi:ClpP class serine protease
VVQLGREFDTYENVHSIAQGRVWSGTQAKQIGLVDELGGMEDAITLLASQLKLPKDFEVQEIQEETDFEVMFGSIMGRLGLGDSILAQLQKTIHPNLASKKFNFKDRIWALSPNLNIE